MDGNIFPDNKDPQDSQGVEYGRREEGGLEEISRRDDETQKGGIKETHDSGGGRNWTRWAGVAFLVIVVIWFLSQRNQTDKRENQNIALEKGAQEEQVSEKTPDQVAPSEDEEEGLSDQKEAEKNGGEKEAEKNGGGDEGDVSALLFVPYTNRAVQYSILRPQGWYWAHYIKSQIGEAHPDIEDYFITDPNIPPTVSGEKLGQVVVAVSSVEVPEPKLSDLQQEPATVAGIPAVRYSGERNEGVYQGARWIEYQFVKDGRTFQIIYINTDSSPSQERIFERVVSSFYFPESDPSGA